MCVVRGNGGDWRGGKYFKFDYFLIQLFGGMRG